VVVGVLLYFLLVGVVGTDDLGVDIGVSVGVIGNSISLRILKN
jgi:hypothetical protein